VLTRASLRRRAPGGPLPPATERACIQLECHADHRFDGGAAAHLAFDLRGDTALLFGRVDPELVIGRRVVAAVAGVGMQALDLIADELFDRWDDLCERVSIIRIARSALAWMANWPPLQRLRVVATLTLTPNS
jgi:hypothetical protein